MHQWNPLTHFPSVTASWRLVWSLVHGSSHAIWGHHCLVEPILLSHTPHTNLMECVTLTFRPYEYDKSCCPQLFYDSPHRVATPQWPLCQRIRKNYHDETTSQKLNPEAVLYETFDLTSLPPVTHHKDPSPKYVLKAVSVISSHSGDKMEAFPARDPCTDQTGLTWADYKHPSHGYSYHYDGL